MSITAISGLAMAHDFNAIQARDLVARQGDQSFVPSGNVVSSCASNEVKCPGKFNGLPYCVTPSRGDVCCAEGYGCPGGNFCLNNGLCCPNGIDPKTCAAEQGVALPNGFIPGKTVAFSAVNPSTSSSSPPLPTSHVLPSKPALSQHISPTKVSTDSYSSSSSVAAPISTVQSPHGLPGNLTIATSTASGTGAASTSITPFTGSANVISSGDKASWIGGVIIMGIFGLVL